jgi:hypothetical protein
MDFICKLILRTHPWYVPPSWQPAEDHEVHIFKKPMKNVGQPLERKKSTQFVCAKKSFVDGTEGLPWGYQHPSERSR